MRSSTCRFQANHNVAIGDLSVAIKAKTPGLDPALLEIASRARLSPGMSNEQIENRLGPFADEILRIGYRQLATVARENNVDVLVLLLPRLDDADAVFREQWESISRLTRETGLEAVSLEGVYGPLNDRIRLKLASWDWHPNTDGHALLAERIHPELLRLVSRATNADEARSALTDAVSNAR